MDQRPYATMVTNFDSTEQKRSWERLLQKAQSQEDEPSSAQNISSATIPSIEELWLKNINTRTCESLLNAHTSFATHFAGIIRTAYLYCPQIMLSDAEVCDGLFFLALGPNTVNSLLGKSYKDGPSIIISGRCDSFEECLFNFTLSTVGAVQAKAQKAAKRDDYLHNAIEKCPAMPDQYTIRPLEYCALDCTISYTDALSQPAEFYQNLTEKINLWKQQQIGNLPEIISFAFSSFFEKPEDTYAYLAQRWRDWLNAVACGLVLYENQNAEDVRNRINKGREEQIKNMDFDKLFARYSRQNNLILETHLKTKKPFGTKTVDAVETLHQVAEMSQRSEAFAYIDKKYPDKLGIVEAHTGKTPTEKIPDGTDGTDSTPNQLLKSWYQFVYQRTLATHLGACLIAVAATPNAYEQIAGRSMADFIEEEAGIFRKMVRSFKHLTTANPSSSLTLSGSITKILGGMPYHVFSCFCYEARTTIDNWRNCSPTTPLRTQKLHTRNTAYLIQKASEEVSLLDDAKGMRNKTALAFVLAFISAFCDQIWFNDGTVPLWLVVIVTWLVSVVPDFGELFAWIRGVHSSAKTVVFMGD